MTRLVLACGHRVHTAHLIHPPTRICLRCMLRLPVLALEDDHPTYRRNTP